MQVILPILEFIQSILTKPAWIMGLFAFVGLVALKRPAHKVMTGTLKPILGYIMLSAGAAVVQENLAPLGTFIETGFHITGVVPNNEVVVSMAQSVLGVQTMMILILGYVVNIIIARFTKFKYIFLTGHHSMFMACLLSAVLQASGFQDVQLVIVGGMFLGLVSAMLPAVGQRFTEKVTDGDEIAMGHFGSLAYYISAAVGTLFAKDAEENSTEKIEVPEKFSFLRDTTISTALTMAFFYLVTAFAAYIADPAVVTKTAGGDNVIVYALTCALSFAVGVTIVYNGVRMILADLVPAFQGISNKLIPGAIPAVDCAVFSPMLPPPSSSALLPPSSVAWSVCSSWALPWASSSSRAWFPTSSAVLPQASTAMLPAVARAQLLVLSSTACSSPLPRLCSCLFLTSLASRTLRSATSISPSLVLRLAALPRPSVPPVSTRFSLSFWSSPSSPTSSTPRVL